MIKPDKYSYCINTFFCDKPYNAVDAVYCADCGARLLIGDRYRITGMLEKPKSAVRRRVYKGIDTHNEDKEVVLKIIDYPDEKLGSYLKREYEFLRTVPDPFLQVESGAYFEWLPDPENDFYTTYVLALPWIDGQDSLDWVKKNGPISEAQCIDWIFQILEYLEIMSDMSTMHRDIKPENVIVTPDGTLKLIDFGSARRIDEDYVSILEETSFNEDGTPRRATRTFTFGYSPPEQLVGRAVKQSDYFALGKTAIFWVTGKTPADLIEDERENWFEVCPNISKTFIYFINWLTGKKVGQRPVDAFSIRQYLEGRYEFDLEGEKMQEKVSPFRNPKFYIFAGILVLSLASVWLGISQILYGQGVEAVNQTQYEKARKKFKAVLNINRFHGDTYYYLGIDCFRRNDEVCAEKNFKESLKWTWNPGGPLYHLGLIEASRGNFDKAREFYKASIDAYQRNPESYNQLARLEISQNDLDKAQEYVELGLKFASDEDMKVRLLNQQGRILYDRQEWEQAEQVLIQSNSIKNTAESACLLPKIKQALGEPSINIEGLWHSCFYAPSQYPEGDAYKEELFRRAFPSLSSQE